MGALGSIAYGLIGSGEIGLGDIGSGLMADGEGGGGALKSTAYISPFGAELDTQSNGATTSTAMLFAEPPFPPTTDSTTVRLWFFDRTGSPAAPTGVWFAAVDGGTAANPTLGGGAPTWVAATGLQAAPAGDDDEPGLGPVCAYANVATTASVRGIAVRIQLASGTYTRMNAGTTSAYYPVGVSLPTTQGSISGNPAITSGWGEAFGQIPAMILEYGGLSTPVVSLAVIGDSHTRGYVNISGARGPWDYMKSLWIAGTYPNVSILNLGRAGHTQSQISGRLQAFEPVLDVGGWIRQVESVNNRNGGPDFTTAIVDAMIDVFESDMAYLAGRSKPAIGWQGPGMNGLVAGAYGRYILPYSDGRLTPYSILRNVDDVVTDVAGNGVYLPGMSDDGGGHPGQTGQAAIATDMAPDLAGALAAVGISV